MGVGVDHNTALDYLDAALEAGDPEAAHWMGVAYLRGLGVEANNTMYVQWLMCDG